LPAATPARELPERPGAGLSEEEEISSAKYLPRELPPRVFEEERFLFPESYGVNRVRLLVKDPEWLFAYWDVDPASLTELRGALGERAMALSRLTLRILDSDDGGASVILLPEGARWWYVRIGAAHRSYRAQLGVTLPSGEFRPLAESNTVVAPWIGPSPEGATRVVRYRGSERAETVTGPRAPAGAGAGPWVPPPQPSTAARQEPLPEDAGGSDVLAHGGAGRGGASDVYRR
jgi:hypothetical protein